MKRKKIVAGNWKMNLLYEEAMSLVAEIVPMVNDEINTETILILIPPFPHLYPIGKLIGKSSQIYLGAQNCDSRKNGAYTGEVSAEILQSYHVKYVLVGHSERRLYFGESNEILAEKLNAVLRAGLTPIFCVGEDLQTREAGDFKAVIFEQLAQTVFLLEKDAFEQIVIAYEPIWAIGTGKTASSAQAQEVHQFIRSKIAEKYGEATAEQTSILYGGSCKASNAQELFACPDVDGGLIGGASLLSREFVNIAKSF
jgi:triosephosphate isomerase